MPGPKRGFTTPHTCATVDSTARNQPLERDRKAQEKLLEKVSDFQVTFDDDIYLRIGLEAKRDIYNSVDPNEPYDIHLEPPSNDHPPFVAISPSTDQAEARDPTFFEADPLQPGKVCLHSWMLYTPHALMLDLTGEHIKTKEDIKAAFHSLNLCTHDEQKSDGAKGNKAKQSK